MKKYIKDNRIISATEKAYDTIYKDQGYYPCENSEDTTITSNDELEKIKEQNKALEKEIQEKNDELENRKKIIEDLNSQLSHLNDELLKLKVEPEKKNNKITKSKDNQDDE